jgi:hypothetical protein
MDKLDIEAHKKFLARKKELESIEKKARQKEESKLIQKIYKQVFF